jgi:hypothetical protein
VNSAGSGSVNRATPTPEALEQLSVLFDGPTHPTTARRILLTLLQSLAQRDLRGLVHALPPGTRERFGVGGEVVVEAGADGLCSPCWAGHTIGSRSRSEVSDAYVAVDHRHLGRTRPVERVWRRG